MVVKDGASALFWTDRWLDGRAISELAPNLVRLVPRRTQKNRTVREALADRSWIRDIRGIIDPVALLQYFRIWERLRMVQLSDAADTLHLEADLEVLAAATCQNFHLAHPPGGEEGTPRVVSCPTVLAVRPINGDHESPYGRLPLLPLPVA
ncbi:hypothetical protein BRADI_4g05386v3 [Brachypodium distachyon]|uniref:Reverse transcriptase zinc-binding domain-containing protein n=1 Tax=Brachypodium distachyon TaxID=15368 RepID=A0A2K2CKM9_BRADI|nr:hypothetical protein BRADI_4g05386v3 [Brachypodium distachyon]